MDNTTINQRFSKLNTAQIADACVRLGIDFKLAPAGIQPIIQGTRLAGRASPVKHYGSVDIFFEAMINSDPGDILIIDNNKRNDEGCIGDLTAMEAKACGLAGIVLWGFHRDTMDLIKLRFPIFSYGSCPTGPLRLDVPEKNALDQVHFGESKVTRDTVVFADTDGVIFSDWYKREEILAVAEKILKIEQEQASKVNEGILLRNQFQFEDFLKKRGRNPHYSFRKHLRAINGAIEE